MATYFVDTNIFLRFLLKDNEKQHNLAEMLFRKAEEGKISLWTTDIVILEIIWTLKSLYDYPKKETHVAVTNLFGINNLKVNNKKLLIQALKNYTDYNVDFADAYNYQLAQTYKHKILSFDKDFDRLGKRENIEKLIKIP